MRYAIIENGNITNIVESDFPLFSNWVECQDGYAIGDLYDGIAFSKAPVDLSEIRAQKWEEIKAYRDKRLLEGGYPVGYHWYYSDLIARSQHQANARKADNIEKANGDMNATMTNVNGDPIYIKSMDNGYMPISANTAHAIVEQAEVHEMATYAAALTHKAALYASANPASYDYSSGWPETYTGA